MSNIQFRRKAAAFLCFLLVASLFIGFPFGAVYAKGHRTVKVAFFPMSGYHEKKPDGSYSGMDVEYLDRLCQYADWDVEFVECDSWDDALQMLADHEVDLVGTAQYSAERAAAFQYADLASGYTFGIIAANPHSALAYEDFEAMKDITFGMVKTYIRRDEFLQYLADNGVGVPRIREYDSASELKDALATGEINAMVHTFMEIPEGQRLIGRFAPRPFYYITWQGNDEVMRELNYAIADLKMNEPALESRLMNEFYQSRLDKTIVFTTAEKEFLENADPVAVGYFDNAYPFLYEDDGVCRGLTRDMLDGIASLIGLDLEWKRVESPSQAGAVLASGEVDLMAYCVHQDEELGQRQLVKLRDYTQVPLVLVMGKSGDMGNIKTLASVAYLEEDALDVVDHTGVRLMVLDSQKECLEAVKGGQADAAICDGYLAEYQLSTEIQYHGMEIKRALNREHNIAMSVRSEDTMLASILNKIIIPIDARAISDYMLERNIYAAASISQFLEEYNKPVIFILAVLLASMIFVAVHIYRDTRKIQKLMYKDIEVDLWNINHLIYTGKKTLQSDRLMFVYAVAYLNISHFQRYKVVYGWDKAQQLLVSIADVLSQCVRGKGEVCAKADGDHFVLLMSSEFGDIRKRLENIGRLIEEYIFRATGSRIALQMGVYFIPSDSTDVRGAITYANQAIDFLHSGGDSKLMVFDAHLQQVIRERHERQKLLDSISINDHFAAYYQAKVDIRTGRIVGAEALVRFLDPTEGGVVRSPGFFIDYYEQTGRVTEVDFFVFRRVCRMLRRRLDEGLRVVTISCNFSRLHFANPDFISQLIQVLDETGVPKELIEVEVTETLVMEEFQQKIAEQTMNVLYEKGIRLSIDDFGSGYSSLGVIEKIPASVIKLDRSFLLNQEDRGRQVKIMKRIVDLAADLGAQIVCEGVETEADVELMREIGANVAQGYRYAKPVPEADFERRLTEESRAHSAAVG